jgi:tetratricopeptide (TPR) repeat protein
VVGRPHTARFGLATTDRYYRAVVDELPLSSRDPARATVAAALAEATRGSGRVLLLVGDAGIGKTTLAREAVSMARRDHITTRWAACSAGGATVAHSPWVTLLNGLGPEGRDAARSLARSDPDPGAAATTAARASAYAMVLDALEQATTERPALLVLDDLHWADEGTLQLLDVVAAHVPAWPVLVVGAYRDTDVAAGSPLTRLGGRAERVTLSGLDRRDVGTLLARQLGPARGADLADRVVALTAGNPFLIGQIAQLLAEDRGARDLASFPAGARDLMEQRLSALDGDDRRLLVAAAVLGSPFRAVDLAELAGCDVIVVTAGLERAASRRAVERAAGTGRWSFVHELFRYAALADAAAAEVADLHRAAAALREGQDAEPAIVAAHLLAAGDVGEDAGRWSTRAGDRALGAMAWEEATAHYDRALSVGAPDVDTRADALAGLGRARLLAGDQAGAGRAFAALAELGRSLGSTELLARAALAFSADLAGFEVRLFEQRQIDLLEEAARALAGTPMFAWRADVLARLSVALSLSAPSTRRLQLAEEAVALARASDDRLALARCLAAHCDAIAGPTHVAERDAEASEIIAIAEAAADGPLELLGRRLRFVARLERGDINGVEAEIAAFARRAEAVGNPLYSWYVPLWRGQAALTVGQVDAAERLADEAEMLGRAAGSTNGPVLASVLRLMALWHRGEYARAVEMLAALGDIDPELPTYITALGSIAWAHLQAGNRAAARLLLDRTNALGVVAAEDAEWMGNMANIVRAAAALDHPILPAALELIEPFADLVVFEGIGAGLYGAMARFVAEGCRALGRFDDAVHYAELAVAVNRTIGGVLAADAVRTLASCVAAAGDGAWAATLHDEADAAYRGVGMGHLARDAERTRARDEPRSGQNEWCRDGDVWRVAYAGSATIVKHSKGMADLATLLSQPGRDVHVTELEGLPAAALGARGADVLDRSAVAAYRERISDLAADIDEADAHHDTGRAARARAEYDALVHELTRAMGIGGRRRTVGPEPVERLRKAVSARIRDAIRHVDAVYPTAGRHLANSVRTGVFCTYRPEVPTAWRCQTASGAERA